MTTLEMKQSLHERIDQLDDQFLKAVYAMIETYASSDIIVGYELNGDPVLSKDLEQRILKAETQIQKGEYLSMGELKEKVNTWRNTK